MKNEKPYKIVIWGSGGISRETAFLIEEINQFHGNQFEILGYIEKDDFQKGRSVSGYPILGTYEALNDMDCDGYVVPTGNPDLKRRLVEEEVQTIQKELKAFNLIHPSVVMRKNHVILGVGNIIGAGAVLTTDIIIGDYNLINLNCTLGHNVQVGDFNVINPLVAISGGVQIGNGNLIGTGASIIQNIVIQNQITIGAGAVVTRDIHGPGTYVGVPARALCKEICS